MARRPDVSHSAPAEDALPLWAEPGSVAPEYRRRIAVPPGHRRSVRTAFDTTEGERAAIAQHLGLVTLEALSGDAEIRSEGAGVRLSGVLRARVVQTCVVTLDPVSAAIEQTFERRYLPPERLDQAHGARFTGREIDIAYSEEEEPEPLIGEAIELGDVVVEELSLALDPFPRAPGAELAPPADDAADSLRPFAALAQLKRER